MSDIEKLFGSDSEDEGGKEANKSGSNSPSGSSNSGSSSGSDNESNDGASVSSAASNRSSASSKSGQGSGPASPAASNSASNSGSADSGSDSESAKSASAPASPSNVGSAPASPVPSPPASPTSPKPAPASPAHSESGPGSPSGVVTPVGPGQASPVGPEQASPVGPGQASPVGPGQASPVGSGQASPVGPGQATPVGSGQASPASNSSAGSKRSKSSKKSGSRSPVKQNDDSDSDIPTKGRARISDDSDSGSDVASKPRQRLPSDSGSDPEAVRATAEDIFGEADDISEDERDREQEPEEKEEIIPETRIEVEIPRVVADLGERLSFAKLPNFLSVETRPFDPSTYEDEIDEDEVMDEEGRARLKLKVENTIRWRHVKDPTTGEPMTDEFGEKVRESNSKVVKWSDGSMSLHLGTEIFDVFSMPMQDHNHLYIRQGTGLQGQAMFKNKLSFRPHSTDSFTHRKMTMSLADRSSKTVKIKVLPIAGVDPELSKTDNIKKEEERLRASVRRENQQRRTRERGYGRGRLDASLLDEGVSLNAIKSSYKKRKGAKSRDEELSDSADEEYETDGEDDFKHSKLQRAKRLDDSDDNSEEGSDGEAVKKKSKVMSGSESD